MIGGSRLKLKGSGVKKFPSNGWDLCGAKKGLIFNTYRSVGRISRPFKEAELFQSSNCDNGTPNVTEVMFVVLCLASDMVILMCCCSDF